MVYLNVDESGYLYGLSYVDTDADSPDQLPSVESLEGFDVSGIRLRAHRWDGEKLTLDETRLAELLEEERREEKERQILALKEKLAATDYAVIKIAEGSASPEEYAEVIAQRKAWREEINRLEGET